MVAIFMTTLADEACQVRESRDLGVVAHVVIENMALMANLKQMWIGPTIMAKVGLIRMIGKTAKGVTDANRLMMNVA